MILGSARVVRAGKAGAIDPRRVPAPSRRCFARTRLKSSGGDPRVLLERLVVELCGVRRGGLTAASRRGLRRPWRQAR